MVYVYVDMYRHFQLMSSTLVSDVIMKMDTSDAIIAAAATEAAQAVIPSSSSSSTSSPLCPTLSSTSSSMPTITAAAPTADGIVTTAHRHKAYHCFDKVESIGNHAMLVNRVHYTKRASPITSHKEAKAVVSMIVKGGNHVSTTGIDGAVLSYHVVGSVIQQCKRSETIRILAILLSAPYDITTISFTSVTAVTLCNNDHPSINIDASYDQWKQKLIEKDNASVINDAPQMHRSILRPSVSMDTNDNENVDSGLRSKQKRVRPRTHASSTTSSTSITEQLNAATASAVAKINAATAKATKSIEAAAATNDHTAGMKVMANKDGAKKLHHQHHHHHHKHHHHSSLSSSSSSSSSSPSPSPPRERTPSPTRAPYHQYQHYKRQCIRHGRMMNADDVACMVPLMSSRSYTPSLSSSYASQLATPAIVYQQQLPIREPMLALTVLR